MKIFSWVMAGLCVEAMETVEDRDAIAAEMEAEAIDMGVFHDFYNTTSADFDINYPKLVKEYFEGGANLVGGNVRGRGRAATAAGPIQRRSSKEDKEFIQRFLQLKYSILFLQQHKKNIGRYCFYGCWCLPNGSSDLGVGTGPPIDDIDRSCREFATCYNCLYNTEIGRGCNEKQPGRYTIKGRMDPTTKERYLMCMDPPGSCKRMRCECDRSLAEKLREHENQWNVQNHRRWGTPAFDAQKYCTLPSSGEGEVFGSYAADGNYEQSEEFTGQAGADMERLSGDDRADGVSGGSTGTSPNRVVQSAPIYGEIVGCCGRAPNLHYFRKGQKCCQDGEVVDGKAPCNVDFL